MSQSFDSDDGLGPREQASIDELCDRFELAWRSGNRPAIEDYLSDLDDSLRGVALAELLRVELEFLYNAEAQPDIEDYYRRFPAFRDTVNAVCGRGQDVSSDVKPLPSSRGSRGLHIRCPHCNNHVELVTDSPFESITCAACGSTFNLAVREEHTSIATPLRSISHFELISRLGVGGFGTVWKARDTDLDRVVAVKIPRKGQLDARETEQFFREARAAAQLRHPNIVTVYEVGRDNDTIFIVSDLVRGVTLSDWLTGQPPSSREAAVVCKKVAEALDHAHEKGVIHRDLKPSNIILDLEGEPHLMDFGLAKREAHEVTMTVDGQLLGTPAYMSPEQADGRGHWTDRRTDIYSLGVIMFEMLTGDQPFRGNAQMQVHQRLLHDAPEPRSLNRNIPRDLSTICLKCLERDPNRRFPTARHVVDELKLFLDGQPIRSRPISRLTRLGRWCRRNPSLATVAVLTLVLAIGGPLTALRIEGQRHRLSDLVTEKNNLIERMSADREASVNEISRLTRELDKWTGQANPWEMWPPKKDEGPRHAILMHAYDEHYQSMANQLKKPGARTEEEIASAHLGLAMLADCTGHKEQAVSHYELARGFLEKLSHDYPEQPQYRRALADCHLRLSRLCGNEQEVAAVVHLEAAIALFKELAGEEAGTQFAIARLDAEMRCAVFAGLEDAGPTAGGCRSTPRGNRTELAF